MNGNAISLNNQKQSNKTNENTKGGSSLLDRPIVKNTPYGKQKFVKKIIVDMDHGDIKTLDEAL